MSCCVEAQTVCAVIGMAHTASSLAVVGGSTTTRLNMATTPSVEHRYIPPSSAWGISIRSTFPSGAFGRGRPSPRDHVTMASRDTLHTSTTVCPAVMVEGPSMVTVGGVAVREEGGKEVYYAISS